MYRDSAGCLQIGYAIMRLLMPNCLSWFLELHLTHQSDQLVLLSRRTPEHSSQVADFQWVYFTHQVTCLRGNVEFSCIPVNFCQRYTNLWATVDWKKCRWFLSLWMWMDAILLNPLFQCLWTHLTVGMQSHALKCAQRALQRSCS